MRVGNLQYLFTLAGAASLCTALQIHFPVELPGLRSTPVTRLTSVMESNGKWNFSCARRMASASGPFVKQ